MTEITNGTWTLDPLHSAVSFSVRYLIGNFRRDFTSVNAQLVDGALSGSADVQSLDLRADMFREHVIVDPAFFDSANYPTLTFSSSDLTIDGSNVTLDGELTIKGVTKPIRATGTIAGPSEDQQGRTRLGLALGTTVDRTDFGIGLNWPPQAMAHEVAINVDLYFGAAS
jgi:polyisoprenoid-binding protein YceI